MIRNFAEVLRKQLNEQIVNYKEDVARGQCKTFDDYTKLCGTIRGLELAQDTLQTLLERALKDDDE